MTSCKHNIDISLYHVDANMSEPDKYKSVFTIFFFKLLGKICSFFYLLNLTSQLQLTNNFITSLGMPKNGDLFPKCSVNVFKLLLYKFINIDYSSLQIKS